MYQMIEDRVSVPDKYAESLVTRGVITHDELSKDTADYTDALNQELKDAENVLPHMSHLEGHWRGLVQASEDKITTWDTGICLKFPSLPRRRSSGYFTRSCPTNVRNVWRIPKNVCMPLFLS